MLKNDILLIYTFYCKNAVNALNVLNNISDIENCIKIPKHSK